MSETDFIQMREIVKVFNTEAGEFYALKGINVAFRQGEFVAVVGKSGSGKSTLANMLTGIDRPTSGEILVGETAIQRMGESQMAYWRGRNMGIVFQFYQLLPMLSLIENVMLPMHLAKMYSQNERRARALDWLDMVGLADFANKRPASVSGGQQQSAAIARALANDPPILVADEPTGNLDSKAAENVFHIFEQLAGQNKTIIMVTHDNSLAKRAQRTLLLADGEVINETIAATLPLLSHRLMLAATRAQRVMRFAPGEVIVKQGSAYDYFYLITSGFVDVSLEEHNQEILLARLGPGQYFGATELVEGHAQATSTVRAAPEAPLELVALDRSRFEEILQDADQMRSAIYDEAQARLALSKKARKSKKPWWRLW
jgi:ABC-type lipoprotein export system ATPase subunit